jgi:NADPH:quinone reductase-like Zn-dependent oxidoreductase
VNGAGTTIGFAAAQIAVLRGLRVIATAGPTYAGRLVELGAQVTPYGAGMADRVLAAAGGNPVDVVFDAAPPSGALPDLVRIAGGDPKRVLTCSDFGAAEELGVRDSFHEDRTQRVDVLREFVGLAAAGRFCVPIARTWPLDEWRAAMEVSRGGQARGKLLLLP